MTKGEAAMTDTDQVFSAIREHLTGRGLDGSKVVPEAELLRDLDLDSLDTMELTLALEERFAVEIPDADLEGLVTVADAVELIRRKTGAGAEQPA
ncbi:MAG: phosphopantetheine-binding protein [Actinomycetota bacterium]|nr:phosphopantetheine-binding protein [Actinomycetota bacterium]